MKRKSRRGGKDYINLYKRFIGSFMPNWLLKRTEISAGAKLCYARLIQFAGKDGKCYPSQDTLGKEIGVSARSVRDYLKKLEEHELIVIVRQGINKPNNYYFLRHKWIEDKMQKTSSVRKDSANQDRKNSAALDRKVPADKENQLRESKRITRTVTKVPFIQGKNASWEDG